MEGKGEVINVGRKRKTVNELKLEGELAEAYKTIAENNLEIGRLREEIAVLKEKRAEEIIPKECWGIVFEKLGAEDLLSCRQVCKTFNQLLDLKEFKGKWNFKLILPLLFPYLNTNDPDLVPWHDLFNARLTCQSWRHWIDKYASEVYGKSLFPSILPFGMPLVTRFATLEDIEEFEEKFGEYRSNPFPARSVCIMNYPDEDEDDKPYTHDTHDVYVVKFVKMLKRFGKHIFKLRLCLFKHVRDLVGIGPGSLILCALIKIIAIHLPNLKELFIHNALGEKEDEDEVASYIAGNVLAPLPNLKVLNILGLGKKVEEYLLDAFGSQLTHLGRDFPKNLQFQIQQLKNVQKLSLGLGETSETLESLRFLESPLKLLKVLCIFESSHETWNVDKLLRNLKHLPIECLEIKIRSSEQGGNVAEAGLDIEEYKNASIKTLTIRIDRPNFDDDPTPNQISFNFLQALTKLENLELELKFSGQQLRTTHPGEVFEVVKLNEYMFGEEGTDLPYQSNIWEKVPSLKTLTTTSLGEDEDEEEVVVNKSTFTKEKYERIIAEGARLELNS